MVPSQSLSTVSQISLAEGETVAVVSSQSWELAVYPLGMSQEVAELDGSP